MSWVYSEVTEFTWCGLPFLGLLTERTTVVYKAPVKNKEKGHTVYNVLGLQLCDKI